MLAFSLLVHLQFVRRANVLSESGVLLLSPSNSLRKVSPQIFTTPYSSSRMRRPSPSLLVSTSARRFSAAFSCSLRSSSALRDAIHSHIVPVFALLLPAAFPHSLINSFSCTYLELLHGRPLVHVSSTVKRIVATGLDTFAGGATGLLAQSGGLGLFDPVDVGTQRFNLLVGRRRVQRSRSCFFFAL